MNAPSDDVAEVLITADDFSVDAEYRRLLADDREAGACVLFSGLVRDMPGADAVQALEIEHYPAMAEASIAGYIATARQRWRVRRARVIHRIGRLAPAEQIVLVGVTSTHRGDAFAACEYIMDQLKAAAPFWKKEVGQRESHWVEMRERDLRAAARWRHDRTDDAPGGAGEK